MRLDFQKGWKILCVLSLGAINIVLGQEALLDRKVELNTHTATIEEVLTELSQKGEFTFSYSNQIPLKKEVFPRFGNQSIKKHLNHLFPNKSIKYIVEGNKILLKPITQKRKGNGSIYTIEGILFDSETGDIIPYGNVFFNASMSGTVTDSTGYFQLRVKDHEGQTIVFSSVAHEAYMLKEHAAGYFYTIYLKPKEVILEGVVVRPDDIPRKRKERMFKTQFLGTSSNAKNCEILNVQDIRLVYFKSSQRLEAYCDKPIIIINKALGYKISYFLEWFKYDPINVLYSGNFFFETEKHLSKSESRKVKRRKRAAYHGSRMHFIRSLWKDSLKREGFIVSSVSHASLDTENLVIKESNDKRYILSKVPLTIRYKDSEFTLLKMEKPMIHFNQIGYCDAIGIDWAGEMSEDRVGDLLPFEYWP